MLRVIKSLLLEHAKGKKGRGSHTSLALMLHQWLLRARGNSFDGYKPC
jgi:hypothetical protein